MSNEAGKGDDRRPEENAGNYGRGYDTVDWSAKEVICPDCGQKFMMSSKYPHIHTCSPQQTTK